MRALRECRLNKTSAFVQELIDASAAIPLRKSARISASHDASDKIVVIQLLDDYVPESTETLKVNMVSAANPFASPSANC